jgi:hypothetical protein
LEGADRIVHDDAAGCSGGGGGRGLGDSIIYSSCWRVVWWPF